MEAMGDYAFAADPSVLMVCRAANSGAANADLRAFKGKRAAVISEWPQGARLDVAAIKRLTGRDQISARAPYEREAVNFENAATIFIGTNFKPSASEDTIFASGRAVVVPFKNVRAAGEQDYGLRDRLRDPANLSAVLRWMVDGLWVYQFVGTPRLPESMRREVEGYAADSDPVARFVDERCEAAPGAWANGAELFEAYRGYCESAGESSGKRTTFYQALESKGYRRAGRMQVGGKRYRDLFCGLRLSPSVR